MAQRLYIKEDITDWLEECKEAEIEIESDADLANLIIEDNVSTSRAARHYIVLRELGETQEDILVSNKLLLNFGARSEIQRLIAGRTKEAKMPNGKTYEVREYLGWPMQPADGEDSGEESTGFVSTSSDAGLNCAEHYLLNAVPGHIWSRLTELAAGGRDVVALAEELKQTVDEMVERLVNGDK